MRRSTRAHRSLSCLLLALATTLLVAGQAISQTTDRDDPFAGVEEMIVTGTGTAALLAPQSTSAIAFDAADLEAYGVDDVSDIAAYVPNLEIRSQNATNASFFIRGVGLQDFGANASSSVPIFQDGIPRNPSATQLVGLFDIGGLSVLKGPQGSGNYRNASAGVFIVTAAKPTPDFSGSAKVTLSRIVSADARDANRYNFETAMSLPVYEDIVSARLSARYKHENPFVENGCANRFLFSDRPVQRGGVNATYAGLCGEAVTRGRVSAVPEFLNRYEGEVDDFGIRGQFRVQPPDTGMDWLFRFETSRMNRDSVVGQHLGTGFGLGGVDSGEYQQPEMANKQAKYEALFRARNPGAGFQEIRDLALNKLGRQLHKRPLDQRPYRGDFDSPGQTLLETYAASITGNIDLEPFDVEINLGYLDYRKSEWRDTDLSPNSRFPSHGNDQAWEFYGDIALSGDQIGDAIIEWDAGLYALVEQVEATLTQVVFDDTRTNNFTQEIYSFGVFAQGRYEFREAFSFAAGLRYNSERKDFEVERTIVTLVTIKNGSRNQRTWDAFTGFGEIRYNFTEDIGTYMKYSRGFKAGHFNPSKPDAADQPGQGFADPESVDAVEWGLDYAFWDARISGSSALFYYNYKNYQVFRLTTTSNGVFRAIQNARRARNYGAEVGVSITPLEGFAPEAIEGLRIKFEGGWLATNFTEFTNTEERTFSGGNFGVSLDYSGNQLINAANLQVAMTFTWPLLLGSLGTLTPQYDFTWTDDIPFDPNEGRGEILTDGSSRFSPYLVGNRAYILHNVRLTWEPPGESGLQIAGWCRNLTDQRYKTFSVDVSTFSGQLLNFVGDPRTCGAEMQFSW